MAQLSQDQLIQMVSDVAVTRTLVETHDGRLQKLEDEVSGINEKLNGHKEWKEGVDAKLGELKVEVAKGNRTSLLDGLDKATIVKLMAFILAAIFAGSAGGDAVSKLVQLLLGIGG